MYSCFTTCILVLLFLFYHSCFAIFVLPFLFYYSCFTILVLLFWSTYHVASKRVHVFVVDTMLLSVSIDLSVHFMSSNHLKTKSIARLF